MESWAPDICLQLYTGQELSAAESRLRSIWKSSSIKETGLQWGRGFSYSPIQCNQQSSSINFQHSESQPPFILKIPKLPGEGAELPRWCPAKGRLTSALPRQLKGSIHPTNNILSLGGSCRVEVNVKPKMNLKCVFNYRRHRIGEDYRCNNVPRWPQSSLSLQDHFLEGDNLLLFRYRRGKNSRKGKCQPDTMSPKRQSTSYFHNTHQKRTPEVTWPLKRYI